MRLQLLIIFSLGICLCHAQDTITISPIVGNVIDSSEKVQFHIFPYYSSKLFIRAVFIQNADSSIVVKTLFRSDSIAEKALTRLEFDQIRGLIEGDFVNASSPMVSNGKPVASTRKNKPYRTNITLMSGEEISGILYKVNISSIEMADVEIPASDIKTIQLVRKNGVGRGVAKGVMIGAGVGVITGIALGDDKCDGFCLFELSAAGKAFLLGVLLTVPGALIGGIVGASSTGIIIPINGSEEEYLRVKEKLRRYSSIKY